MLGSWRRQVFLTSCDPIERHPRGGAVSPLGVLSPLFSLQAHHMASPGTIFCAVVTTMASLGRKGFV